MLESRNKTTGWIVGWAGAILIGCSLVCALQKQLVGNYVRQLEEKEELLKALQEQVSAQRCGPPWEVLLISFKNCIDNEHMCGRCIYVEAMQKRKLAYWSRTCRCVSLGAEGSPKATPSPRCRNYDVMCSNRCPAPAHAIKRSAAKAGVFL
jgi:hypothetical protein